MSDENSHQVETTIVALEWLSKCGPDPDDRFKCMACRCIFWRASKDGHATGCPSRYEALPAHPSALAQPPEPPADANGGSTRVEDWATSDGVRHGRDRWNAPTPALRAFEALNTIAESMDARGQQTVTERQWARECVDLVKTDVRTLRGEVEQLAGEVERLETALRFARRCAQCGGTGDDGDESGMYACDWCDGSGIDPDRVIEGGSST